MIYEIVGRYVSISLTKFMRRIQGHLCMHIMHTTFQFMHSHVYVHECVCALWGVCADLPPLVSTLYNASHLSALFLVVNPERRILTLKPIDTFGEGVQVVLNQEREGRRKSEI